MEFLETLKALALWNNSAYDYAIALAIFIGLIIILKIFQVIILARLNKLALRTKTDLDDMLIEVFKTIKPPFYFFISIYFAIKVLVVPDIFNKILLILFLIAIVFEIIQAISRVLDYIMRKYLNRSREDGEDNQHSDSMVNLLQVIVKIILWALGLVLILSNLGIDVTSLIAGMGIGGLAIALALQNVLSDLFSAFSIYIDKPFRVGDHIQIGTDRGEVEKIGMKTTRIRTLQGEQLIVSNQELTNARINNFRRMEKRRVAFNLGVTYDTKAETLEKIPKIIEDIVLKVKGAEFDRCYFTEYADSALIFETVIFIESSEYKDYLDARQEMNFEIYKIFAREEIDFAYPTQTIHLQK
jgi:small-conductance mechanosensitive channel